MENTIHRDQFLEKRLAAYDQWLAAGRISYSSKVIPVSESFHPEQWVLPTAQAMKILENAGSASVQNCECRSHYHWCDHPLEVCLVLNRVGDGLVAKGKARRLEMDEAASILKNANRSG